MSSITKLKSLLEGNRIISVSESKSPESICGFCVESHDKQKTSFTLYATDLGYWVGDLAHDNKHSNMTDMLDSIYNHVYGCKKKINYVSDESLLCFKCDCKHVFLISKDNITQDYKDVLKNDETVETIAKLLSEGVWFDTAASLSCELDFAYNYDEKRIMLVTVVHNRKQYLRQALDSALNQSLDKKYFVHLVIDSGSTQPECREIIKEYCDIWPHMEYRFFDENINQMPAYNWALKYVQDIWTNIKYLAMLDSDDLLAQKSLEVGFNTLEENDNIDIIYSDFNMIGAKGEVLTKRHPKSKRRIPEDIELTEDGQKIYRRIQLNKKNGNIATHFRFIRLDSLVNKMGGFREDYPFSTDFCIYCDALGCGMALKKIDQVLYHWRNHRKGKDGATGQVEKDHGTQQRDDYLDLRDEYEKDWTERGLI